MGPTRAQVKLNLKLHHLTQLSRQGWEGVLDCTQLGPVCMQYSFDSFDDPNNMTMTIIGQVIGHRALLIGNMSQMYVAP